MRDIFLVSNGLYIHITNRIINNYIITYLITSKVKYEIGLKRNQERDETKLGEKKTIFIVIRVKNVYGLSLTMH